MKQDGSSTEPSWLRSGRDPLLKLSPGTAKKRSIPVWMTPSNSSKPASSKTARGSMGPQLATQASLRRFRYKSFRRHPSNASLLSFSKRFFTLVFPFILCFISLRLPFPLCYRLAHSHHSISFLFLLFSLDFFTVLTATSSLFFLRKLS